MPLDVPAVLSLDRFCTMQTSRGCPYPCVYCDIPALTDGKWRCRSAEHVLGEMQQLHDQGYRSIYLTDDHFLLKRKRIEAICQGIIDRKLPVPLGLRGSRRLGGGGPVPAHGEGQLRLPGLRHRGGHAEGPRPPQEGADPRADRARGRRGEAPRDRDGPRLLPGRLAGRDRARTSWRASASRPGSSSTRSASTGCASTAARRSGRSTSSAGSSTTSATGTSGSSARTSTRPSCRARW